MKEIKFRCFYRGQLAAVKEMTMHLDGSISLGVIILNDMDFYPDSEHITGLTQYTGLKDKNGKEIYEGDIVNCFGCPSGMSARKQYIGKVDQDTFGWTIVIWFHNEWWAYGSMDYSTLEIIGNIYQDKHLLK